jgi:Mg2+ and Co2+ transporter CorA
VDDDHKTYSPDDIQNLQHSHDKVTEAMMMLEGNVHVMNSLKRYYASVINRNGFPAELKLNLKVRNDVECFSSQVEDIIENLTCNLSRARFLAGLIRDRKDVIQFHFQGQAAQRMEHMNLHMENETVVMGIITLVTLIYLPATFVSVKRLP